MNFIQGTKQGLVADLLGSAKESIASGYYSVRPVQSEAKSLVTSIKNASSTAVIAEIKFASLASGRIAPRTDVARLAKSYESGGAVGISVLTEPTHFSGRLTDLSEVKRSVNLPVLMKDIIIDPIQVDAAKALGADAILLIARVFRSELPYSKMTDLIEYAHASGLEALLEVHSKEEFSAAAKTEADLIGINNRNLDTLEVSLDTSVSLLKMNDHRCPVVCESGIQTREEVLSLKKLGADAFLVGSSLMRSRNPALALRELVKA